MNNKVQKRWEDKYQQIKNCNRSFVIAADEVGYGAWAGPVVVCAVKAPKDWNLEGLNDSKNLTKNQLYQMRDKLQPIVAAGIISFALAERSNLQIDLGGLGAATQSCFAELFKKFYDDNSLLIADGNFNFDKHLGDGYLGVALPKADATIPAAMAASILAKTYRDDLMKQLHCQHPEYDWNSNVGYHSRHHVIALNEYGITPYHRTSFKPIQKIMKSRSSLAYSIAQEIDEEILGELLKLSEE